MDSLFFLVHICLQILESSDEFQSKAPPFDLAMLVRVHEANNIIFITNLTNVTSTVWNDSSNLSINMTNTIPTFVTYNFTSVFGQAYTSVAQAADNDYWVVGSGSGGGYASTLTVVPGGLGGGGIGLRANSALSVYTSTRMPNTGAGGGDSCTNGIGLLGSAGYPVTWGGAGGSRMVLMLYALCRSYPSGSYSTGTFPSQCLTRAAGSY
jgi:hypothetical protein